MSDFLWMTITTHFLETLSNREFQINTISLVDIIFKTTYSFDRILNSKTSKKKKKSKTIKTISGNDMVTPAWFSAIIPVV